ASEDRGSVLEPASSGNASGIGSDGALRVGTSAGTRALRRSGSRIAVQHVPQDRTAARSDLPARARLSARGGGSAADRRAVLRGAGKRLPHILEDARRAQPRPSPSEIQTGDSMSRNESPRASARAGVLPCLVAIVILLGASLGTSGVVRAEEPDVPVNQGGVLLVHDHGLVAAAIDSGCNLRDLTDRKEARVNAPVEEGTRLIGVYAEFAPGDSVLLAGITFGILYSPSVTVVDHGGCG